MTVQQFDEKQDTLVISGLHVAINRNERTVTDDEGNTKYEYDVEAFDVEKEEDIDKETEAHMLFLLHEYDKSKKVNNFKLQGNDMWLDKSLRDGLFLRFISEQKQGLTTTKVSGYSIPIDNAFNMLYELEVYASACWDNTDLHEKAIKALPSAMEKAKYDFTVGYPLKQLEF